jgi:apolipoprotein D and lipocalin family protein
MDFSLDLAWFKPCSLVIGMVGIRFNGKPAMRDIFTALLFAVASTGAVASTPLAPVADLDLERYAGTWHEIARLPMWFQRKCASDVTAHYVPRSDGTVAVHNACVTAEGKTISSDGVARRPDAYARAKLEVRFAPAWLSWVPLVWADYWVLAIDDDYRWAMVGQPGRKYLWILSREPSLDKATFDELKAKATAMGYDLTPLILSGKVD